MTDLAAVKPGNKYKIVRIDKDVYVVPEGFEKATPGGYIGPNSPVLENAKPFQL